MKSIFAAVLVFVAFGLSSTAQASDLDLDGWLRRPGARLVVVEFFASWCQPCMKAVPRWRALHERYRDRGLRLVVVATRDASGTCESPGWTPDEIVCDLDGVIADRLGASALPAAFLWDWQGHLLAQKAGIDEVEARVDAWMKKAPRVHVEVDEVPQGFLLTDDALLTMLRGELRRLDKMVVVADEAERASLRALQRESLALARDEGQACEVGAEMSANSLLRARVTKGQTPRLLVSLFSVESGCLVASVGTRWADRSANGNVSEAVAALLGRLRLARTERPGVSPWSPATSRPRVGMAPLLEGDRPRVDRGGPALSTSYLFVDSDPRQATVFIDGREVGHTPYQDELPLGRHRVEVRLGELYAPVAKTIELPENGLKLSIPLPKRFGVLQVRSDPPGAEIFVDGAPTGARTPHVFPKRREGRVQVELRLDLHKSARATAELGGGKVTELALALPRNYGALEVRSEPSDLEIVLDERATGRRTPHTFDRVQAGVHTIQIRSAGKDLGLIRKKVEIDGRAEADLDLRGYRGVLQVTAQRSDEPVKAVLTLDGKDIGETPFQQRVAPGVFTLVAETQDGERIKKTIRVDPSSMTRIDLSVGPNRPLPRVRIPEEARVEGASGRSSSTVASIVLLTACGLAAGGSVFAFVRFNAHESAIDEATSAADAEREIDSANTARIVGWALAGSAAALGVAGLIALWAGDDGPVPVTSVSEDGGYLGVTARW